MARLQLDLQNVPEDVAAALRAMADAKALPLGTLIRTHLIEWVEGQRVRLPEPEPPPWVA